MDLVLVRHGEPVAAEGRCIGATDVPLSPRGEAAMSALGGASRARWSVDAVQVPTRLAASDLCRAAESAKVLGTLWGLDVKLDPRLRELDFGEWDGRSWEAIHAGDGARLGAWAERWAELAPPGGEALPALAARARSWIRDIYFPIADVPGRLVVVTHAGWIRAAVAHLLDRPLQRMFEIPADYARATVVRLGGRGAELVAVNAATFP